MKFEHADQDPNEEGISEDEMAQRIEFLDIVWWPKILEDVQEEHDRLNEEHGESFTQQWDKIVNAPHHPQHGFEAG